MPSSRLYALIFGLLGALAVVAALVYYAPIDRIAAALVLAMAIGLAVGFKEQWQRLARIETQIAGLAAAKPDAESTGDADLDAWVDARVGGASATLSSASYAPFLVGLFVMLGLLGTFLGLFETLRGARLALTAATDPEGMRHGLTAPMLGLTRSFGCSAAGVAASACLGLVGMIVRGREGELARRLQRVVARRLQGKNPSARIESLLEDLAKKFDGIASALSGMGSSLDVQQKESLVRLEGSLSRHTEALGGLQATLTEGHARELAKMGDALLAHADKVAAPLLLQGDKLFGQMDGALKSVTEAESRMSATLSDATQKMGSTLSEATQSMTSKLASTTAALHAALLEAQTTQAEKLSAAAAAMSNAVADAHSHQGSALGDATTALTGAVAAAVEQTNRLMLEQQNAQHQALADALAKQLDALDAHLPRVLGPLDETAKKMLDAATQTSATWAAAQGAQSQALADALAKQLEALDAHLPRVIGPLDAAAAKMTDAAIAHANSLQASTDHLGSSLAGSAAAITEALGASATGISSALADSATGVTRALAESGAQMVNSMAGSAAAVGSSFAEAQAAQHAALAEALAKQLSLLETHVEHVVGPLDVAARSISDAVGGHADALKEGMLAVTAAATSAREGEALHVDTVRELVAVAREGLVSVKVGGAELEAAASMFTAAASAHQEGARAWLGSLDAVDERVRQSGKAAAAEALQKQLEYTHKIFGEQLKLHRELFEEVRGARRVTEHLVHSARGEETADGV